MAIEDDRRRSTSIEALRHSVKEQRFHLRGLDITIDEMRNCLLLESHTPSTGITTTTIPGASSRADQETSSSSSSQQQQQRGQADLQGLLQQRLDRRREMLLELRFVELELEILLLRRMLAASDTADGVSSLLPRCAECFVDGDIAGQVDYDDALDGPRSVHDEHRLCWPVRRDSLLPPDKALLMPPPLRIATTLPVRDDHRDGSGQAAVVVRVRTGPERRVQLQREQPRKQRHSLKGLVRRLTPRKSTTLSYMGNVI